MNIVLISTYDLGRQPFGLASPAAWLRSDGHTVSLLDLSQQALDEDLIRSAHLVAVHLPMHTATRLAVRVFRRAAALNHTAHLCAYGLYAPMNAALLRELGVQTILGGEFEDGLLKLSRRLRAGGAGGPQPEPVISLERQAFRAPDREGLPPLSKYAHLVLPEGERRVVGYTEASRGCKHRCRHCPIVPVYEGNFRIVQRDVVLEDIRRQVAAGAEHITFGDPDFFNGPGHALEILHQMHREFPQLSYDVTIKVEHLLKHAEYLPLLRDTGCAFVVTAVESLDDRVLKLLEKGHTRADFLCAVEICRGIGLALSPTFIAFTPWTTLEGYEELLAALAELDLVESVSPVQLAIRLLIPEGSRMLELPEVREIIGPFDRNALSYRWEHSDPRVDALQEELEMSIQDLGTVGADRPTIFAEAWQMLQQARQGENRATWRVLPPVPPGRPRATIPYLTEPWYC